MTKMRVEPPGMPGWEPIEQREQSRICSDYAKSRSKKTAGQKAGDALGDIVKHAKIIGDTLGKIVMYLKTRFPWLDAKRQKICATKDSL